MKGKYKAAFIIPIGAKKVLGEDGWEFETSSRLSSEINEYLVKALKLRFLESYLGIDSYVDDDIKMSILFDDQKQIESIHFQLYGDALTVLSEVCQGGKISDEAELFIPHQGQKK